MSGALEEIVGGEVRRRLYAVYAFLGLVLGATQVAFLTGGVEEPTWLRVTFAVFVFVGTQFGFTAAANVQRKPQTEPH